MRIPFLDVDYENFLLPDTGGHTDQMSFQDRETGGCAALFGAVLHRAIWDLVDPGIERQLRRAAACWIASNRSSKDRVTFVFCCEVIGIPPSLLRVKIGEFLAAHPKLHLLDRESRRILAVPIDPPLKDTHLEMLFPPTN